MKKIIILLSLLAGVVSCQKYYEGIDDSFQGSGRSENNTVGRNYMIGIVNDLIVDNLLQMENALFINDRGGNTISCNTGGKSLTEEGAEWTMTRSNSSLNGLIIKYKGENSWFLERTGDYPILDVEYPTNYKMTVTKSDGPNSDHYNWDVVIVGDRIERNGYSCSFYSDGVMKFTYTKGYYFWNECKGYLMMSVKKNNEAVDDACLVLDGGENEAVFRRVL